MKNNLKNIILIDFWCYNRDLHLKIRILINFELDWSLMSEAAKVFRKSTKITKNVDSLNFWPNGPIFSLNHLNLSCNRAKIGFLKIIYLWWKISILVKRSYFRPFFKIFRVKFKREAHFLFQIRNLHWISNRIGI